MKKIMSRIGGMLFMVSLLFISWNHEVSAAEGINSRFEIEVQYGFEGTAKYGMHMPVYVTIENQGETFAGKVQIMTQFCDSNQDYMDIGEIYTPSEKTQNLSQIRPIELKANEKQKIIFTMPVLAEKGNLCVKIEDGQGAVIEEKEIPYYSDYISEKLLAGIASQYKENFKWMDEVSLADEIDLTMKTVELYPEDFPDQASALDSLNILVPSELFLKELSQEQRSALNSWIASGGILLLEKDLWNSQSYWNVKVAQGRVAFGNGLIIQYDPLEIAAKIEAKELTQQEDIKNTIFDLIGLEALKKQAMDIYYSDMMGYWSFDNILRRVTADRIPNIWEYAAVLVVYLLLISPFTYLFLKKKGKRHLYGLLVAGVSFLSIIIIFLLGYPTRFRAPFVNYMRTIIYEEGYQNEKVIFNVQAPFNDNYNLLLNPQYQVNSIQDISYYYNEQNEEQNWETYKVSVETGADETTLNFKEDAAFESEYFSAEKNSFQENTGIESKLTFYDGKVSGTVTNNTGADLENTILIFYNQIIQLDSIRQGETKTLKEEKAHSFSKTYMYLLIQKVLGSPEDIKTAPMKELLNSYFKEQILQYHEDQYLNQYVGQSLLLAFQKEEQKTDLFMDDANEVNGKTLAMAALNVDFTKSGKRYDPYIKETATVEMGEYDTNSNVLYSEEAIIKYHIGSNVTNAVLSFGTEDYYDEEGYQLFDGTLYFWNVHRNQYEKINYEKESVGKNQLDKYLDENGDIKAKYVKDNVDENNYLLPVVTLIGGTVND